MNPSRVPAGCDGHRDDGIARARAPPVRSKGASSTLREVLPGATVTLRQPAAAVERASVTDSRGAFRLPLLPVGDYELTATIAGFETRLLGIRLTVGQTADVRIELALASASCQRGRRRGGITNTRSQVSATIDEAAVRNLPVNGRNFLDFALLTPGVTRDARQGDLSFAGQRGTLNSLVVDGADNNNTFAGQSLGRTDRAARRISSARTQCRSSR